ncbi:hypothetical protein H0H92_000903 [Tricholoma furcatifolium]|nr:hypothetical protein H0H92_000903 [Tricholoma furcatifolium]
MLALCGDSGPLELSSACVRAAWSALVPFTLVLILSISMLFPPIQFLRPYLTLDEATAFLSSSPSDSSQEPLGASEATGKPAPSSPGPGPRHWHSIFFMTIGLISTLAHSASLFHAHHALRIRSPTPSDSESSIIISGAFALSWLYTLLRPLTRPTRTHTVPYDLFAVYLTLFVGTVVQIIGGVLYNHKDGSYYGIQWAPGPVTQIGNLLTTATALGVVLGMPMALPSDDVRREDIGVSISPEDYTTLFGWMTFSWVYPLFKRLGRRGRYTRTALKESDVWNLSPTLQSRPIFGKFMMHSPQMTLLRKLWAATSRDFILMLPLTFLSVAFKYAAGPFCLKRILDIIDTTSGSPLSSDSRPEAYAYAFFAFFCALCKSQADALLLWYSHHAAATVRVALTTAMYDKALKRKDFSGIINHEKASGSKSKSTNKEEGTKDKTIGNMEGVINHISTTITSIHQMYAVPFEIVFATISFSQLLGFSFASFIFWIWLLHVWIMSKRLNISLQLVAARGRRMNLLKELIGTIKSVKLFALEDREEPMLGIENGWFKWNARDTKKKNDGENRNDHEMQILTGQRTHAGLTDVLQETDINTDLPFELQDINVRFPEGKLTVITGPPASGKTALLMALLGEMTLLPHTPTGRILMSKHPDLIDPSSGLTYSISYAAQTPWLRHQSIRDNILFGIPFDSARYYTVLDACALNSDLKALEDGDLTEVGAGGVNLNEGQKARVALARAVYSHAKWLLLDDPLSAMDNWTAEWIIEHLLKGEMLKGRTVVLVTHSVELVLPTASYIVHMLSGQINAQGTVNDLYTWSMLDNLEKEEAIATKEYAVQEQNTSDDEKDKKAQDEMKKPIKNEHGEVESVKWAIYKSYLKALPHWIWVLFVLLFVFMQILSLSEKVWIMIWSKAYKDKSTTCFGINWPYAAQHPKFYIGVYVSQYYSTGTDIESVLEIIIISLGSSSIYSIVFPWFLVPAIMLGVAYYELAILYLNTSHDLRQIKFDMHLPIVSDLDEIQKGIITLRAFSAEEKLLDSLHKKINNTTKEPQAIVESNRPPAYWPSSTCNDSLIVIENLSIKHAPGFPSLLQNISFTLKAGQRVGLLGPTGSGKSTLAMSIFRFVEPTNGRILIDGLDISTIGIHDLRSRLMFIPQDVSLFSGTLRENLDPFNEHTDADCFNVLQRCHMISDPSDLHSASHTASRDPIAKPNITISLDTEILPGGTNFSQGQRQLICIARALLRCNSFIVLEDTTRSSINLATDAKIQTTIQKEFTSSLLLTISQHPHTVIDYDCLIVLNKGQVAEFGTPWKLIQKQNGIFRNMCLKSGTFRELENAAKARANL